MNEKAMCAFCRKGKDKRYEASVASKVCCSFVK